MLVVAIPDSPTITNRVCYFGFKSSDHHSYFLIMECALKFNQSTRLKERGRWQLRNGKGGRQAVRHVFYFNGIHFGAFLRDMGEKSPLVNFFDLAFFKDFLYWHGVAPPWRTAWREGRGLWIFLQCVAPNLGKLFFLEYFINYEHERLLLCSNFTWVCIWPLPPIGPHPAPQGHALFS